MLGFITVLLSMHKKTRPVGSSHTRRVELCGCGLILGMANPAKLLHDHLRLWRQQANQMEARDLRSGDGWISQRNAVRNLEDLIEVLDLMNAAGKDVAIELSYIPTWTKAVFAYPMGWQAPGGSIISQEMLNFLHMAGTKIDDFVPQIKAAAPDNILDSVNLIEESVLNRKDLPDLLRMYLGEVAAELRKAVQEYSITGDFVLNKAVRRFAATVELLEEQYPGDATIQRVKARVRRWYKTTPAQLVSAGIVSYYVALGLAAGETEISDALESLNKEQSIVQVEDELPEIEGPKLVPIDQGEAKGEDTDTEPPTTEASQ